MGASLVSLEYSTSYFWLAPSFSCKSSHPWQHSVSRLGILFSGGLKDGLRHLRNSWKLSFQSAFSSDSSMRASTQSPLKENTREALSARRWLLPYKRKEAQGSRHLEPQARWLFTANTSLLFGPSYHYPVTQLLDWISHHVGCSNAPPRTTKVLWTVLSTLINKCSHYLHTFL